MPRFSIKRRKPQKTVEPVEPENEPLKPAVESSSDDLDAFNAAFESPKCNAEEVKHVRFAAPQEAQNSEPINIPERKPYVDPRVERE